jgi:hypothetical protein
VIFLFTVSGGVRCPFCDEKVSPRALVCRYCTRDLDGDSRWESRCRQRRALITGLLTCTLICGLLLAGGLVYSSYADKAATRAAASIPNWAPPRSSPQPAFSGVVTLTSPAAISNRAGRRVLPRGTRLQFVALSKTSDDLILRYSDGGSYSIPVASTDFK